MIPIDYHQLSRAIGYYSSPSGGQFKYIDVPWAVPKGIADITRPTEGAEFPYRDQMLVASGEQSFLWMISKGELQPGRYQCVTPCFRHEETVTEGSRWFFMKLELIDTINTDDDALQDIINRAVEFLSIDMPGGVRIIKTADKAYDIVSRSGIELGSYGIRWHPVTGPWIYGTGCAEPRRSYAEKSEIERLRTIHGN